MGGDSGFFVELLRENNDQGAVNFLLGAGGGGKEVCFSCAGGAGGGGGNLTGDIFPERPCRPSPFPECCRGGSFGNGL